MVRKTWMTVSVVSLKTPGRECTQVAASTGTSRLIMSVLNAEEARRAAQACRVLVSLDLNGVLSGGKWC